MRRSIAFFSVWLASVGLVHAVNPALPNIPTTIFNVTDYGAIGNGVKDNTTNIQNTINAASAAGGGIVEIPAGTFLSGPITLLSSVNLQVDTNGMLQMLPLGTYPGGTTGAQTFIGCNTVHDVEISGWGKIDGQGAAWWTYFSTNTAIVRPMMLNLYSANRLFIHDITFQNPPYHHCGLRSNGGNITISNLTINTPYALPTGIHAYNTDGLNFVATNSIIENCHITDGDDDIAMGSTGPLDGLLVTNCTFGAGHGVSIGSGVSVGVSNLTVINSTFNATDYGIRMKSDTNSGGIAQNLNYLNLGMTNLKYGAITIYSYYNESGTPTGITPTTAAGETISPVNNTTPVWRNITFSNLTATVSNGGVAGIIWGRTELPATNIVMNHVNITASKTFDIYNAQRHPVSRFNHQHRQRQDLHHLERQRHRQQQRASGQCRYLRRAGRQHQRLACALQRPRGDDQHRRVRRQPDHLKRFRVDQYRQPDLLQQKGDKLRAGNEQLRHCGCRQSEPECHTQHHECRRLHHHQLHSVHLHRQFEWPAGPWRDADRVHRLHLSVSTPTPPGR